ncbi:MAG: hypothetical protein ACK4IK_03435 [Bacteroidia bacterium]
MIIFDEKSYKKLLDDIRTQIKEELTEYFKQNDSFNNIEWISQDEARKFLPLKSKTSWQKLRDSGLVVFSQMGRKILYSKESLIDYIDKHKIDFKNGVMSKCFM